MSGDGASGFTREEKAILHSIAEMFQDKDDRDELRRILDDGRTLQDLILAYKTNRKVVSTLKALGAIAGAMLAIAAAAKQFGFWPK